MSSSPELTPMFFLISSETSSILVTCQEHKLKYAGSGGGFAVDVNLACERKYSELAQLGWALLVAVLSEQQHPNKSSFYMIFGGF